MSNLVEQPILNDAYLEPTRHWHIEAGREPELRESRRPAQYVVARAERKGGAAQLLHEAVALDLVNRIRERVKAWREAGYPGVTRVTRELLTHWNRPIDEYIAQKLAERSSLDGPAVSSAGRRTFFCQRETVETVIWLTEAPEAEKTGITIPSHLLPLLMQGKVFVTNWHVFALEDDSKKRGVVKRGVESDAAFCERVLKKPLGNASNFLVLNDEAHHAYRVYPKPTEEQLTLGEAFETDVSDKEEAERARVWIKGLDRIAKVRGIRRCLDLSATPYFLKQSGRKEGEPFERKRPPG